MVFIPKEAQDKIQALEAEVERLREVAESASSQSENTSTDAPNGKKGVSGFWVFFSILLIILLILSQVFSVQLFQKGGQGAKISEDSLQVVMQKLEKLSDYEDVAAFRKDAASGPGTIYRVQIGAYQGKPLTGMEPNLDDIYEHQRDGFNVYSLGTFSSLKRAQEFQNLCHLMGMPNAYIIAFENGKPVSLGEANKN
jgi:hypothetical protein